MLSEEKDKYLWFHLYVESKKENKWTKKTEGIHRYREHFDGCQMAMGLEGRVKKRKWLRCAHCQLLETVTGSKVQLREYNQ